MLIEAGICDAVTAAAWPCTESTTATVLASGWRWIASTTERLPLNQLAILSFSTLSMTLATSSSLTGAPLR